LTSNITPCVIKSCSQEDALSVQSAADGVCKCANDWVVSNPKQTTCYAPAGASGSFAPGSSIPPSSFYATTKPATTTKAATTSPTAATPTTPLAVATAGASKLSIGAGMIGAAVLAVVAL